MKRGTWDHRYDEILYLPHPVSKLHPVMPRQDRAAQFGSFKALAGFEDEIDERGRFTETAAELDENRRDELDERLNLLLARGTGAPAVEFVWFCPDERKDGGRYRSVYAKLDRLDQNSRTLFLSNGDRIQMENLYAVQGAPFLDL